LLVVAALVMEETVLTQVQFYILDLAVALVVIGVLLQPEMEVMEVAVALLVNMQA